MIVDDERHDLPEGTGQLPEFLNKRTAITPEQLDELERAARAAGVIRWYGSHDAHMDYMRDVDAEHIAANSPDVTLHLVGIARAALEKDRRIAELESACQSVRSGAAEAVAAHDAQVARIAELESQENALLRKERDRATSWETKCDDARSRIVTLELRLSIATELNVGDRKRIAELEAIVSSTDDLVRQLRNALAAALEIGRASEGNDLKWRTLTKHASQLLPSEET